MKTELEVFGYLLVWLFLACIGIGQSENVNFWGVVIVIASLSIMSSGYFVVEEDNESVHRDV